MRTATDRAEAALGVFIAYLRRASFPNDAVEKNAVRSVAAAIETAVAEERGAARYDHCYANALPDEPMFVLLARDPDFFDLVNEWASRRQRAIERGERPESDKRMVAEAEECALAGSQWRRENEGKWREGARARSP
jgi:hypothetical protein